MKSRIPLSAFTHYPTATIITEGGFPASIRYISAMEAIAAFAPNIPRARQATIAYRGRQPGAATLPPGGAIGAKNININWPYFK